LFFSLFFSLGGGQGNLLVSPFNVEWGCYAQAGGVEESNFCLFLVIFPARCISSISPRFYFRKHAFCFLPLAAILESYIAKQLFGKIAKDFFFNLISLYKIQVFYLSFQKVGFGSNPSETQAAFDL
jgi:hypothetical protein